jgi:hypothetical protein
LVAIKKVINFRHLSLVTGNISELKKILTKFLNLKIKKNFPIQSGAYINQLTGIKDAKIKVIYFELTNSIILEVIEYSKKTKKNQKANSIGFSHFSITVKNIDQLYKESKKYDIKFISEPLLTAKNKIKVAYIIVMGESLIELVQELP